MPIAYDEIIHLPTVKVIEEFFYDDISYKIVPNKEVSLSNFSLEELSVLETVATNFKNYKSREMVYYMHNEKAYTDTESYQIIPYSLSEKLNDLR